MKSVVFKFISSERPEHIHGCITVSSLHYSFSLFAEGHCTFQILSVVNFLDATAVYRSPECFGADTAISGGHFAKYWGGGILNMYAFSFCLRYANLSNIMLGISNSLL